MNSLVSICFIDRPVLSPDPVQLILRPSELEIASISAPPLPLIKRTGKITKLSIMQSRIVLLLRNLGCGRVHGSTVVAECLLRRLVHTAQYDWRDVGRPQVAMHPGAYLGEIGETNHGR